MNLVVFPSYRGRKCCCKQSSHFSLGAHFLQSVETEEKQINKYILCQLRVWAIKKNKVNWFISSEELKLALWMGNFLPGTVLSLYRIYYLPPHTKFWKAYHLTDGVKYSPPPPSRAHTHTHTPKWSLSVAVPSQLRKTSNSLRFISRLCGLLLREEGASRGNEQVCDPPVITRKSSE